VWFEIERILGRENAGRLKGDASYGGEITSTDLPRRIGSFPGVSLAALRFDSATVGVLYSTSARAPRFAQ